jgi:NADPH:quinone reductase
MRTIECQAPGGPEVMKYIEVPDATPAPGQLRVRLEAAGVNFVDTYQRSGAYKVAFPLRPGLEGAGAVEAVGAGVQGVAVGDRVAWSAAPGSYAEQVLVDASKAVPVPAGVSSEVAAALMLQGMTAHYLAHDTFALEPGQWCVVHAAAGGVGLLLCQLARARGAQVIGVVSTEEKAALAREAGATVTLLSGSDWSAEARRLSGGAHVVYDSVGLTTFDASLRALRPRGLMVLYGQASGAVPPLDPQTLAAHGSLYLTRPKLHDYNHTRDELLARASGLFALVSRGDLKVRVGARFPLSQAADAHRALEGRATTGKVLLLP